MTRSFRPYLLLSSILLLCIGTTGFSDDKPFNKPSFLEPDTPEEQMEKLKARIRRAERQAAKETDPEQRKRMDRIVVNLQKIQGLKAKKMKGDTWTAEQREEYKEAWKIVNKNRAQYIENKPEASKKDVAKPAPRKKSGPNTYETASGFKVRLYMP